MTTLRLIAAAAFAVAFASPVNAQDGWPNRPIKLIVPFPAGGALDALARPIAKGLGERLGQNVVVENKPGGNLVPASVAVAQSAPDGYTLYYTLGQPYSTNQYFFKALPYDVNAYTPIAPIGVYTYTFQVGNNSSYKTLTELVDFAKKNPGKITAANPGSTSAGRLAYELFLGATDTKMTPVPYAGGAAQSLAVASGQVDFMVGEATSSNPFMKSGQVRTLAINAERRLAAFPDVPTLAEAGFAQVQIPNPYAVIVGPKGMPDAIVQRLVREIAAVMETNDVKTVLNTTVIRPLSGGPAEAKALIDNEAKSFGPIIKALNIALD